MAREPIFIAKSLKLECAIRSIFGLAQRRATVNVAVAADWAWIRLFMGDTSRFWQRDGLI